MARSLRTPLLVVSVVLVAFGAAAWRLLPARAAGAEARSASSAQPKSSASPRSSERPVTVQTAAARRAEVRVVRSGLGTVTARSSVQVRSRVSGQLVRVLFKEGDLVQQGQLLAEIDPRTFAAEVLKVEGQITRDKALLDRSRVDLERYETLGREQLAKQEDVEARAALVRQYEGALMASNGQLQQAKLELSFSRVVAPISGRVGLRLIDPGNNVSPSDSKPIVVLNAVQPITVVFSLPEESVPIIVKRLGATDREPLRVEAWDKGSRNLLSVGKLLTLDNQIDANTGTIKLKAEFANEDGALFPNQFVNARLVIDTKKDATVVPSTAIQRGPSGPFVYLVREESVSVRAVELGPTEGPDVTIEKGLESGDQVVVSGSDRLREGARITRGGRPGAPAQRP